MKEKNYTVFDLTAFKHRPINMKKFENESDGIKQLMVYKA